MKERYGKVITQKEKDDAVLNSVSKHAQEAIMDPNLPDAIKDTIVDAAVGTIYEIAERRGGYKIRRRKEESSKGSNTIYKSK